MKDFDRFVKQQKFLARDVVILRDQLVKYGVPMDVLGDVCFDIMMMLDEAELIDEKIVDWNEIFNEIDKEIKN